MALGHFPYGKPTATDPTSGPGITASPSRQTRAKSKMRKQPRGPSAWPLFSDGHDFEGQTKQPEASFPVFWRLGVSDF